MALSVLPIRTERLDLRVFGPGDLDAVVAFALQPDAQRYVDGRPRDRHDCKAALDAMCRQVSLNRPGDAVAMALSRREDGRVVGQVSIIWHDATASQGELRVVLSPLYRRRGYASEAARAVMDLGFSHFSLHRIFARCDARNSAAAKMMRKLGMRLEAHYREHALFQGEWDEELHFAMLDREWKRGTKVRELTHLVA